MKKLFSLVCAVFVTAMTFGASYGILVNGKTYFEGTHVDDYDGFTQYLAHVPLQAGDYCQLYDADSKAKWAVALNPASVEGFTLNSDRYDVSVAGCYDFYIKLKYGADELYIGAGSGCGEGVDISGGGEGGGETPDPEAAKFYVTGDSALVVDAGLDKGKAWNADAIKSTKDTAVLNLKANQYYRLKVVVGTNWLGYDKLTEAAEGLEDLTTDNHNIGFKLNNAGEVKVIYFVKDAQVTFKLLGDFKVETPIVPPVSDDPKMEIAGGWDEWTKHDMTLSGDKKTAVYEVELTAGDFNFKLIKDGAWISKANGGAAYGLHRDWPGVAGVKDVDSDELKLTADVDGKYIFTFTFENDSLGITFPEKGETPVDPEAAKFFVTGDSALVVDAGLDKGKAWSADAIKSTKDTAVLNLKANQDYVLKVVVNDNWLGYDKLSEVAFGLKDLGGNNHNIGFKLNNAGEVKVIYFVKDEQVTFKLLGDFATPKMEIAGGWDEWTKHDMTLSGDKKTAVYEVELTAGDFNFKLIKDGAWISKANGGAAYGLHRDWPGVAGVKDVDSDELKLTADVDGKYIFTWTFENDSIGITFPEKGDVPPVGPELADGFYLIGQNGWDVAALSASLKFEKNLGAENEYQLSVTLVEGQPIKVVYVENNAIKDWYPASGGNHVVTAEQAGNKIIYFNPSKNSEWSLLDGYIYIADGGETAITNTADGIKAVKVLRDGQILIIKGEKTFNVQGQIVR